MMVRERRPPRLYLPKNPASNPMGEIVCGAGGVCVLDAPDQVFVDDAIIAKLAAYEQGYSETIHRPLTNVSARSRLMFSVSRRDQVPDVMSILTGAGFDVEVSGLEVRAWLNS